MIQRLFIILSSLSFALALAKPVCFSWIIFLFLVPLIYISNRDYKGVRFFDGFLWGACFFAMHGLCYWKELLIHPISILEMVFIVGIIIFYGGIIAGFWFYFAQKLISVGGWSLVTLFYFIYIDFYFMAPVGLCVGYKLSFPLLPLGLYPCLLKNIHLLSKYGLLFCLIEASCYLSNCLLKKSKKQFVIACVWLLPFIVDLEYIHERTVPSYINQIGIINFQKNTEQNALDYAQSIIKCSQEALQLNEHINYLMSPESVYPFALNEQPVLLELLNENGITDRACFILGAHRRIGDQLFNALYIIKRGRITFSYEKTYPIPFVETENPYNTFKNTEYTKKELFCGSSWLKKNCILNDLSFNCFICSDFFLSTPEKADMDIFLVILNEQWSHYHYLKDLMLFHAQLTALEYRKPIIYVGYERALWISPYGITVPLCGL